VGLQQELFVLDNAGRVLVYDLDGHLLRQWWMPDYSVGKPEKIFQFRSGRLGVADTHYHRVVFFDSQGHVLAKHGSLGREPGQFIYPVAIVEDDDENYYVCEYGTNDRVQKFDKEGKFLLQFGSFGTDKGQFQRPSGIVWRDHKVYVVDAFNSRIQVFSDAGEFLEVLAEGDDSAALNYPYDIAANGAGELYVAEYGAGRVSKFDLKGRLLGRYGTIGSDDGQFSTPWGIAADRKSRVFVADTGNLRVVELKF
jgi:DNA-binding beta-propeller fold protein YncE